MQLRPLVLAVIALFFESTHAAPPSSKPNGSVKNGGPLSVSTLCYTQKVTTTVRGNPWRGQTSWSTSYLPCTTTSTVVSQVTVTPSIVTVSATTSTVTTITADAITLVSIESTTVTEPTTITSFETTTIKPTSIVTFKTVSTISTPAGWKPVRSTLPGSSYSGKYGLPPTKRDHIERRQPKLGTSPNSRFRLEDARVIQSVACVVFFPATSCEAVTVTQTSTTIASTPTSTVTVTNTLSSTFVPSATTTITSIFTTTSATTIVSTISKTSGTTSTSFAATGTALAVCNVDNMVDTYANQPLDGIDVVATRWEIILEIATANPYDCCVATALSGQPAMVYGWNTATKNCWVYIPPECPATQEQGAHFAYSGSYLPAVSVYGNGPCGQIDSVRS